MTRFSAELPQFRRFELEGPLRVRVRVTSLGNVGGRLQEMYGFISETTPGFIRRTLSGKTWAPGYGGLGRE